MTEQELFARLNLFKKLAIPRPSLFALEKKGERSFARATPDHGLMVYPDAESCRVGLYAQECMRAGDGWDDAPLLMCGALVQMCDREDLDRDDYALIKSLGLRYRGRGQWPRLRRLRPGRVPWYLEEEDRELLAAALDAACALAEGGRLCLPEDELAVVAEDGLRWEAMEIAPAPPLYPVADIPDEMMLARLKKQPKRSAAWEVTVQAFPYPADSGDGGAPVCPQMLLMVDEETDQVLDICVTNDYQGEGYRRLSDAFLTQIQKRGRPMRLRCANIRALSLMEDICRKTGVPAELCANLPQLKEAFESLLRLTGEADGGEE